jgi:acyl dehydratase
VHALPDLRTAIGVRFGQIPIRFNQPAEVFVPVTYDQLMQLAARDVPYAYIERDTLLYAVAIGMGRDPLDSRELDFVYERRGRLRTVPSQAVTVSRQNLIYNIGLSVEKFLHGEQTLTIHHPLPVEAELLADHKVLEVYDKGAEKGSIIEMETRVRLKNGAPLFDIHNLYFARGDGGIGGPPRQQRRPEPMPQRKPDLVRTTQTEPGQALLYRLTGDRNVQHADPDIARSMGFKGPILHGSCTMGIACREVLAGVCDYEPARMRTFGTRFTAVVYPGERIETDIWVDGDNVSFRCRVPEREAVVLDHGHSKIAPR